MTDKELKKLKDDLWHSADVLRSSAHLAANKYGQPILGLKPTRAKEILAEMVGEEIIIAEGGNKNRVYKLKS